MKWTSAADPMSSTKVSSTLTFSLLYCFLFLEILNIPHTISLHSTRKRMRSPSLRKMVNANLYYRLNYICSSE